MRRTRRSTAVPTLLTLAASALLGLTAQTSHAATPGTFINAGGGTYTDAAGRTWSADRDYVGGGAYSTGRRIERTPDQQLFRTGRAGMTGYDIPVAAAGTYRVTLAFAELYWSDRGRRVFSVRAEGAEVVRDLDIFATVGKHRPLRRTMDVAVLDGTLDLRFSAKADRATLASLAVVPLRVAAPTPVPATTPGPVAASPDAAGPACTTTMAPGGSIHTFINGLSAGAVGCIPGGTYSGANVEMTRSGTAAARVTVRSVPGQVAKLRMRMAVTSDFVTFHGLLFDTDHALGTSNVWVKAGANDVTFQSNEFADSGLAGSTAHDGQCLYSDAGTSNIRILRNLFHDCGSLDHFHHSMYLNGSGYTVSDNVVQRTRAYGIHLYPDLDNSLISNNTVDGSGRAGVIVAESSTGNRVVNNVLTNNAHGGVDGYAVAGANTVEHNLCFANGTACVEAGQGFVGTGNVTADPQYLDRSAGDLRVAAGSPAVGTASAPYALTPDRNGVPRPQGAAPDKGAYER